jgi:hypothetical protein
MSEKPSFFSELKRRNVDKVAVAYAVVAWLLIQVTTQVFPFLEEAVKKERAAVALALSKTSCLKAARCYGRSFSTRSANTSVSRQLCNRSAFRML